MVVHEEGNDFTLNESDRLKGVKSVAFIGVYELNLSISSALIMPC